MFFSLNRQCFEFRGKKLCLWLTIIMWQFRLWKILLFTFSFNVTTHKMASFVKLLRTPCFIIYPMPARVSELFRFRSHILLVQRIKACNKFKNLDSKAALLLRKSPFWLCAINFRCTFYGAAEETGLIFKKLIPLISKYK